MISGGWATKRHLRDLNCRLCKEGFTVVGARHGKHMRLHLRRGEWVGAISCSLTPTDERSAVNMAMQSARRAYR